MAIDLGDFGADQPVTLGKTRLAYLHRRGDFQRCNLDPIAGGRDLGRQRTQVLERLRAMDILRLTNRIGDIIGLAAGRNAQPRPGKPTYEEKDYCRRDTKA